MSEDGAWAVVFIAIVGSPFSMRYARALRAGRDADPLRHCHVNVALYGPRARRWVFTERAIARVSRSADGLVLGRSSTRWDGGRLLVDIDEVSPWSAEPLRGTVAFSPEMAGPGPVALDGASRHTWWPVAPRGEIAVHLRQPAVRFQGTGYHDVNAGDEPLHAALDEWTWSRFHLDDESAVVTYVVQPSRGARVRRTFRLHQGRSEVISETTTSPLPSSRWGLAREAWTETGARPRLERSLEDGPFYARHLVAAPTRTGLVRGLAETLSARRLASWPARLLTGFRERRESC